MAPISADDWLSSLELDWALAPPLLESSFCRKVVAWVCRGGQTVIGPDQPINTGQQTAIAVNRGFTTKVVNDDETIKVLVDCLKMCNWRTRKLSAGDGWSSKDTFHYGDYVTE